MRGPAFSIEILQVTAAGINNVTLIIIIETEEGDQMRCRHLYITSGEGRKRSV
jgi:hypothetical protein